MEVVGHFELGIGTSSRLLNSYLTPSEHYLYVWYMYVLVIDNEL